MGRTTQHPTCNNNKKKKLPLQRSILCFLDILPKTFFFFNNCFSSFFPLSLSGLYKSGEPQAWYQTLVSQAFNGMNQKGKTWKCNHYDCDSNPILNWSPIHNLSRQDMMKHLSSWLIIIINIQLFSQILEVQCSSAMF